MDVANPILPGFHPDPSIVRVEDDYFIATSSFEYFPGVPIHHSKDLKTWTHIGHALTRRSQLWMTGSEPGGGIWAPTLRHHKGFFYVAATCFSRFDPHRGLRSFPRGFYVKTDNIWDSNSWTDPIFFDIAGFDQDIFWDKDGSVYLSTTHQKTDRPIDADPTRLDFAIHTCKVDLMTGNALSSSKMIRESPIGLAEGSHLFRRGEYYYLVTAEGGTGSKHSVCIFRNTDGPFAEWESCPRNPILYSGTDGQVQNTGHADFFEDRVGRWWATLLAVRSDKNSNGHREESVLGRETFLVSVEWSDDWPIMNGGRPIVCEPDTASSPSKSFWIDRFVKQELGLGWYRRNTPLKTEHQLISNPSRLRLYGGPYNLDALSSPTMLLRKQTEKIGLWKTKLSYQPSLKSEEAGMVVWWNYLNYSTVGICTTGNERIVSFKPAVGEVVTRKLQSRDSHVYLYVECGNSYRFGFSETIEEVIWLGEVGNDIMTRSPTAGMAFTGMMVGLFAVAKNQRSMNPADFHYVLFNGRPTE